MNDKPRCTIEVLNPDDILVLGINNKWFRTFTSTSDRYPIQIDVPAVFLNENWNLITGNYTNVALVGKNEASVEYKLLLDAQEVVHVSYRTEVQPEHFTLTFKDTFALRQRQRDTGRAARSRSKRFDDLMSWGGGPRPDQQPPRQQPPPLPPQQPPPLPPS